MAFKIFLGFNRWILLLSVISACYCVRNLEKLHREYGFIGKEPEFNPTYKENWVDFLDKGHVSLLQMTLTTRVRSMQAGQQLADAQADSQTSGTVGDELGSFSLQTTNASADPVQDLLTTNRNFQSNQSTPTQQQSLEQGLIDSLVTAQSPAANQIYEEEPEIEEISEEDAEESSKEPTETESETADEAELADKSETSDELETSEGANTTEEAGTNEENAGDDEITISPQIEAKPVVVSEDESSESSASQGYIVEQDPDLQNLLFGDGDIQDFGGSKAKNREYLTIAFLISIFALILLITFIRRTIEKNISDILISRLNSITKDFITVVTVITFTLYLEFMNAFGWRLNMNGICLAILAFALTWMMLSTILVAIGQRFCTNWESLEADIPKREIILTEYRELHKKREGSQIKRPEREKMAKHKTLIEYVLIKQEFIAPTFLPIVSEAFLRDDFNFALYLTHALSGVLGYVLNFSKATFLAVLVNICFWTAITDHLSYVWNTVTLFCLIIVSMITLAIMSIKFQKIYSSLVASVDSSIHLPGIFANFVPFKRDPLACAETRTDIPKFLKLELSLKPYRKVFQNQLLANKQERLFWLGAPNFSIRIIHCLVITHLSWTIIFIANHWSKYGVIGRVLLGIAILALLFINFFYITPKLIRQYTIINHIQMKRDFNLIEKVVVTQRKKAHCLMAKLYRLLKATRKEIDPKPPTKIKPFLERQIADAFKGLNPSNGAKTIKLQDLNRLVHLCGKEIKRDELLYLARESTSDDYQKVHIDDLVKAVENLSEDVKLEPFSTIRDVLKNLAGNETHISLKFLGKVMEEHKTLDKNDISRIIHELKYLSWDGQEVDIDHIAAYIRHNVECMPR